MATILLAYELGSGLGHLNRLVAVARRMKGRHRLVFAVPDLQIAKPVLERFGTQVVLRQGVQWAAPDNAARSVPTASFADVLTLFGFDDPARLSAKVADAKAILNAVRPDLIVADFAPALRLASRSAVPTLVVGNGYTVPPAGRSLPPMRPWSQSVPDSSQANERAILAAVNGTLGGSPSKPISHLADIFSGDETFVCTIAEFDPYRSYRTRRPTWPFNVPDVPVGPSTEERKGPPIFVYLPASHPAFRAVVEALNASPYAAQIYAAQADPHALARRLRPHIRILTKPADFAQVLPQCRVAVHHAGLGTAYAGLAAGTPQLVFPLNLEHLITARGLIGTGVAEGFSDFQSIDAETVKGALTRLLETPRVMETARQAGARLGALRETDPLTTIVAACEALCPASASPDAGDRA